MRELAESETLRRIDLLHLEYHYHMNTAAKLWSLTSLREKLIKIGAKVVRHERCTMCQLAEVACPA